MDKHTKDVLDLYQKHTHEKIDTLRNEMQSGFEENRHLFTEQQKEISNLKQFKWRVTYFSAGIVAMLAFVSEWIKLGVKHFKDLF